MLFHPAKGVSLTLYSVVSWEMDIYMYKLAKQTYFTDMFKNEVGTGIKVSKEEINSPTHSP